VGSSVGEGALARVLAASTFERRGGMAGSAVAASRLAPSAPARERGGASCALHPGGTGTSWRLSASPGLWCLCLRCWQLEMAQLT
jgi:hypothetical protein